MQMSFNREGFMITIENLIGSPDDKTLFPGTLALFEKRMKERPDTAIADLGYRSAADFKIAQDINNVFPDIKFNSKKGIYQNEKSY